MTITNNIFKKKDHGLSGGGNLVVLNNLFLESINVGLKNVTSGAVVAHNLFFGNGVNWLDSDVDMPTTLVSDPMIDSELELSAGSPAINAGTAHAEIGGVVLLQIPRSMYFGSAPDLGAREFVVFVLSLSPAGMLIPVLGLLGSALILSTRLPIRSSRL